MSFKIIGIRILTGCNPRFKKNLHENVPYYFFNEYEFNIDSGNEIDSISYKPTIPNDFYTFNNEKYNGQINISAIVGSNGSGKSNLLELFIASILIISIKLKSNFLDIDKFAEENNINVDDLKSDFEDLEGINIEIIYISSSSDIINKISLKENKIIRTEYSKNDTDSNIYSNKKEKEIYKEDECFNIISEFFYNNYINYSLYSLNSKDIGLWIKTIFHKNDNYQLPIVINPYRDNGIIDINNENYLNLNRFIVNTIQYKELRKVNGKNISSIIVKLNEDIKDKIKNETSHLDQDLKIEIINSLLENNSNLNVILDDNLALITIDYIIYKLIKILSNREYIAYSKIDLKSNIKSKLYLDFLKKLKQDDTHVTLKLKQAINFLIIRQIEFEELNTNILDLNQKILNKINIYFNDNREYYSIIFFLPSFFEFEINFENNFNFNNLSSGEKHKIYILHSIIYHIRNIKSRESHNNPSNISYNNINIILDEVELYMHPEYQRGLISDLITHINTLELEGTNINIIFATHSPFILSDIPSQNVLKLKDGKPFVSKNNKINSLGANIHDMLADEFFLNSGSKGEYIDGLINKFLVFYHETLLLFVKKDLKNISYGDIEKKINFYESVFRNIGDEAIQTILLNNINVLQEKLKK